MIVDLVQSVINSMTAVGGQAWLFFDAELYELNYNQGHTVEAKPFAFLIHPVIVTDKVHAFDGSLESFAKIELYLLQATNFAALQVDRNPVLANMYAAKAEFIKRLLMSDDVQEITGSDSEEVANVFNNNFDGLLLHVTAKLEPELYCIPATP